MRILYVTTISNTVNAFLVPHIKLLMEKGHQVDVAFNIVKEPSTELKKLGCKIYNIEFQRSPLSKKNVFAYKKLKNLIKKQKYDLVHTHTPVASACVRLACRNLKNVKVMYTAHGFHFYKGASLKNWMFFYPIEKWLSNYTDCLITINSEDYYVARNKMRACSTKLVSGVGIDLEKFKPLNVV
ncbi:glycosyltransferase [Ureibacillus sp. FSL W7-1570]|uniref:glycosyltransferase n=1 Tax=Ureibacillus sp. FSL W7-1570 TaxID=2954593 RepID=UPI00315A92B8